MKVWLLRPAEPVVKGSPWYEESKMYHGHVVLAETEERARRLCKVWQEQVGDVNPWLDPGLTVCIELPGEGEERLILSEYWED